MSLFTGDDIQSDLVLECDVCVVGSGAGGAHAAERLSRAGKRVVVLEEGGYHTSSEFNMKEADMYPLLYQEKANRATADLAIAILQGRAVGGTTVVNWTTSFRTPEHVLQWWAEHHGVKGLAYKDLEPHWDEVERRLGIEQIPYENANRNNLVLWNGAKKLGWDVALLRRNVRQCAHLGYCGTGCPIDAKQAMHITLIPDAIENGADLYANVRAETIESDGRKIVRVNGVVLDPKTDRPTGARVTVKPKLTVLCGGGINNPLIFFRSKIGNRNQRVGKRTYLHPAVGSLGRFDEPVEAFAGAPQSVSSHHFARREPHMGFFLEAAPLLPMLGSTAIGGFGEDLGRMMDKLDHLNATIAIGIDGFDPTDFDEGGRVTLRKDGRPRVDYQWTTRLMEYLREGHKACARVQLAAGASEVRTNHAPFLTIKSEKDLALLDTADYSKCKVKVFCAHVMGGCAMGGDPAASVVDSTLRHHEFDNLFIVDGSVFPTSLGVNPQLSIYGLASWASEHIQAALG